jgi:hypothetical protein
VTDFAGIAPSFAIALRDAARDRLKAAPAFRAVGLTIKRWRKSPMRQIAPADLPLGSVYFLSESGAADGDENSGIPHFKSEVTLGISVAVAISDDDDRQDALDQAFSAAIAALLNDGSFVVLFEGVTRYERANAEGLAGANGETPYAEMRLKITFTFRCEFEPVATIDLDQVKVTAQPGADQAADPLIATFDVNES